MFRLMGFLSGAAVAIAILAVMTDPPLREQAATIVAEGTAAAADLIDERLDEHGDEQESAVEPDLAGAAEPPTPEEPAKVPEQAGRPPFEPVPTTTDVDPTQDGAVSWQPVWKAFRSEISARGFAGRLAHLTDQDYRVRRVAPWSYQVELAYTDERQRDAVLDEIQANTGLGLTGTQP